MSATSIACRTFGVEGFWGGGSRYGRPVRVAATKEAAGRASGPAGRR